MAGTWMSIVEGFGGMRVQNDTLMFEPRIPSQWDSYSFKVNFRNRILKVTVDRNGTSFSLELGDPIAVKVNNELIKID